MAEQKKYYWIKLKTDFFDLPTIDWLMDQQNGYAYVVLYQKLCLLTANNGGELSRKIGEMIVPYEVKKIAEVTRFDIDTVVVALELYKRLGLIYEQENGILRLNGVDEMVGAETAWAEKKRLQRQKKQAPALNGPAQSVPKLGQGGGQNEDIVPQMSQDIVREENRDKRLEIRDKRLEIDKEKEIEAEDPPDDERPGSPAHISVPYEQIKSLYNSICISFPKCTAMSEARKKAIRARFSSGYTLEDFRRLFEKTEASSFMRGANSRNWRATFDWLIKDGNMAKVLDGNYDDHHRTDPEPQPHETRSSNPFMDMLREEEARNEQNGNY